MKKAPSDNYCDPVGYVNCQASNALLIGVLVFVWGFTFIYYRLLGEFPRKEVILSASCVLYVVIVYFQGWRGFDTIESFVYTFGFGVIGSLTVFREKAPGSPEFVGNIDNVFPVVIAFFAWLCAGYIWRNFNIWCKK